MSMARAGAHGAAVWSSWWSAAPDETAGYPMIFNIEADPLEIRIVAVENTRVFRPYAGTIGTYMMSLREHSNPPASNLTRF